MASGMIAIKARPLRIAFLVDPTDRAALLQSIEINTFLWAGFFNPIIPAYQRAPKSWASQSLGQSLDPDEIISGYLDGFDPDFVVPMGKCRDRSFSIGGRETITPQSLVGDSPDNALYGLNLTDVVAHFIEEEAKFVPYKPVEMLIPVHDQKYKLFVAGAIGSLPVALSERVCNLFAERIPIQRYRCNIANFADTVLHKRTTPWSLGMAGLKILPQDHILFLCDARSCLDIIDFWNLRAAGHSVIPIPMQAAHNEGVKSMASSFIEHSYNPHRYNATFFHKTTIQCARSVTMDSAIAFVAGLDLSSAAPDDKLGLKYTYRNWYPRLWEEWARQSAEAKIVFPHSSEASVSVTDSSEPVGLQVLMPGIRLRRRYNGQPMFANELAFRWHDSKEPMAEVFPEGSRRLASAFVRIRHSDWRFSRNGPVFLVRDVGASISINQPNAEALMKKWLEERKWKADLSPPGRIAKQIMKRIGWPWGAFLFFHEKVIELLMELGKDQGKSRQYVVEQLKSAAIFTNPEAHLERLLEVQAIRLGARIQCPICLRHNWLQLDELAYKLKCRHCLAGFKPPSHSPRDIQWTYRAYGPFGIGKHADGAYAVLLTLRFFHTIDSMASITPIFSYIATNSEGERLEADLSCLYRSYRPFGEAPIRVLHTECKSGRFSKFEKEDMHRMRHLAGEFPGSILVFSTTRMRLEKTEVGLISQLALKSYRDRYYGRPYSPVLVLTGTELFAADGVPDCWAGNGLLYEKFKSAYYNWPEIYPLCEATDELYLGLPSWETWAENYRKRKKRNS
jgi:hypothetical protein